MRQPRAASPSRLPTLIMPCPICTGRLVFRYISPINQPSDLEDSIYSCERCATEVVRTTLRKTNGEVA